MPNLLSLPAELMVEIVQYLDPVPFGDFRLSCRSVNSYIQPEFDRGFSRLCHMIEHRSLDTLLNIVAHPRISPKVRHITIANHIYTSSNGRRVDRRADGSDLLPGDSFKGHRIRLLEDGSAEPSYITRHELKTLAIGWVVLSTAFRLLKNLSTVCIVDETANRLDIVEANPAPRLLQRSDEPKETAKLVIQMVFLALAEARVTDRCASFSIEVEQRCCRLGCRLPLDSFRVLPSDTATLDLHYVKDASNELKALELLKGLGSLVVGLSLSRLDFGDLMQSLGGLCTALIEAPIRSILSHLVSLLSLTLKFDIREPLAEGILAWLGGIPLEVDLLHPGVPLPASLGDGLRRLRKLGIWDAQVSMPVLLAVCLRFELEELDINRIAILQERGLAGEEDCWRTFLKRLSKGLVRNQRRLQAMLLSGVRQTIGAYFPSRTRLVPDPGARHGYLVRWKFGEWTKEPCDSIRYDVAKTLESIDVWLECMAEATWLEKEDIERYERSCSVTVVHHWTRV